MERERDESKTERIRDSVSKAYTRAVESAAPAAEVSGCCGPSTPRGVTARAAGYATEDLAALPGDAVSNAFGCGNPLAFADVTPGETVLDLGSGAGIDLLLAAQRVGPLGRVIGVDMTDAMIERARANVAAAGCAGYVEILKGVIEELPVEDGVVDLVISNCVINLSPEKDKVFAEIRRVLKPGGRVRVSDLVVEDFPEALRDDATLYCNCIAGAVSESEYLEGLARAGLDSVEVADRLTYDAAQLAAMVVSKEGEGCCGVAPSGAAADVDVVGALTGRVHSIRVHARKP